MAKLFCSEACWKVVDETLQLRGGRGYERAQSLASRGEAPYPVERLLRDCRINTIIEGTSDIMRLFLAREALDPHLTLAGDLLRPDTPLSQKTRVAAKVALFYGAWYPRRVLGAVPWPFGHRNAGRLGRHLRYQQRTAHRLARALFHAMARYGPKLERQQLLLGRLMDIGTELFAMSATCAFVDADDHDRDGRVALADMFCRSARPRIEEHFRAARVRRGHASAVADRVLDGSLRWLEDGIIPCVPEQDPNEPRAA